MIFLSGKGKSLKRIGIPAASLVLGLVLPVFAATVFAGTAQSPNGYFTVNSKNYSNYSGITTGTVSGNPYANAWSRVQTDPTSNTVPAGYMGAKGRLFNGADKLIAETAWTYTSSDTNILNSDFAYLNPAVSGTAYYSYGITAGYNGSGYTQYYTFKSPSQNA